MKKMLHAVFALLVAVSSTSCFRMTTTHLPNGTSRTVVDIGGVPVSDGYVYSPLMASRQRQMAPPCGMPQQRPVMRPGYGGSQYVVGGPNYGRQYGPVPYGSNYGPNYGPTGPANQRTGRYAPERYVRDSGGFNPHNGNINYTSGGRTVHVGNFN